MTLLLKSIGLVGISSAGGTTVLPTYPSPIVSTDALILTVLQKPSTGDSGTVTTPTGWTLIGSSAWEGGYGATLANATGDQKWYVYSKDTVTGSETGTLSITVGTNSVSSAYIIRVSTFGGTISYGFASGGDGTTGSPMTVVCGSDPGIAAGDLIICGMAKPDAVGTPGWHWFSQTITATGVTFGNVRKRIDDQTSTGNDSNWTLFSAMPSAGPSSGAPTLTAVFNSGGSDIRGPGFVLRMRETLSSPLTQETRLKNLITVVGDDINHAVPFDIPFQRPGTLAVFTGPRIYFPDDVELMGAAFSLETAPTGAAAIFEVLKDGSGTFSSDPTIAVSTNRASAGTLSGTTTFTARTNYLQISCSQIGSSVAGSDLTVILKLRLV